LYADALRVSGSAIEAHVPDPIDNLYSGCGLVIYRPLKNTHCICSKLMIFDKMQWVHYAQIEIEFYPSQTRILNE